MSDKKTKRVKHVFQDFSQVIHLWANQAQDWAGTNTITSSQYECYHLGGRRCHFEGTSLYSYSTRIGEIGSYNGQKVALISDEKYSKTTSDQQRTALLAFGDDWIVLEAPDLSFTRESIEAALLKRQDGLVTRIMLPFEKRSWYSHLSAGLLLDSELEDVKSFNSDAKALGFSHLVIDVPEDFQDVWLEKATFLRERDEKKYREKREAREAVYRAQRLERYGEPYAEYLKLSDDKRQEYLERAWIETGNWPFGEILYSRVALVRVEGNNVYTSHGAEVSLSDAKLFLSALKNKQIKKGDKVGPFTFESLKGDVLTIGCHTLSLKQCREAVFRHAEEKSQSIVSNVVSLLGVPDECYPF